MTDSKEEGHAALRTALQELAALLHQEVSMDRLVNAVRDARSLAFISELEVEPRSRLMEMLKELGTDIDKKREFDTDTRAAELRTAAEAL